MLNLTPPASMKSKFWSHTHKLLIFWRCHAVTLCYCTLVIMSKVRSEPCHLIVKLAGIWQASVWGIYLLQNSPKEEEKKNNSVKRYERGCFVSPGFEQMESTFLLDSLSFFLMLSFFFNDLCVTLIIQMFKLPGPHKPRSCWEACQDSHCTGNLTDTVAKASAKAADSLQTARVEMISALWLCGRLSLGLTRC